MAHHVPAAGGVFASPIKETAGFQGLQKCGWSGAREAQMAQRNGTPSRLSGEAFTGLLCAVVFCFYNIFFIQVKFLRSFKRIKAIDNIKHPVNVIINESIPR
jgi:hypothetical protein